MKLPGRIAQPLADPDRADDDEQDRDRQPRTAASAPPRWHPTAVTERAPRASPSAPPERPGHDQAEGRRAPRRPTPPVTEDEKLFARSTRPAFLDEDPWRVLRILSEFVDGFDALAEVGPAVTVFGSARVAEGSPIYEQAREIGRSLARDGWAVITGGGPGVMEAANRGCQEAGGLSIGCNIELPHEQSVNATSTWRSSSATSSPARRCS